MNILQFNVRLAEGGAAGVALDLHLRALQKGLEFNKIGMIETTSVLAGFTFTVISAHYWPLALTAILGYLVNSAVRTLLFGYVGRKIYRPGLISRWHRCPRTCALARG